MAESERRAIYNSILTDQGLNNIPITERVYLAQNANGDMVPKRSININSYYKGKITPINSTNL